MPALLLAGAARAQSPAPSSPSTLPEPLALSAIPATPAGTALRAWFDAFNSGDSARVAQFVKEYGSDLPADALLGFRRRTGGFDLLSIQRSEPRHIEFFVRERNGPTTAIGELELPTSGPTRLVGPTLLALGPNMPVASVQIEAAARRRVVERAAALLDSFYVFPDVARRMGDSARAHLARGDYDAYDSGLAFARHLTDDLAAVSHDKHLAVRFVARGLPPQRPDTGAPRGPTADETATARRELEESNCDFQKVERLEGNIGYLKFDAFNNADLCAPTVAAAMTFLAGTRALIVDLRENGGGQPKMVALVSSYLFDKRTHLNDLWTRQTNSTEEFWTRDTVSGRRFGGEKPVYVLTSARTFSGAEEFTYNLKSLKRATIVGETTGGGAHPVRGRRIDEHFMIGVPFARAINPITHTNWEGVGVEPDTKVPAGKALETALKLLGARRAPQP
ncbi:MAG: S41 family peptidase [Gemmatimonadaceae bacterium]